MKKFLLGILGAILFIASWELLVIIKQDASLVGVDRITKAFIEIVAKKEFYIHLFSTLKIVFIGIAIATACGIILAVIMDLSKGARYILTPLIEALRNIPSITLFPILLVLYGIGDTARIFVIFWTSFPSVVISSTFGLGSVDCAIVEAAQDLGAKKLYIMRKVKMPIALPEMLNGIRIGIGNGFVAIVVAEMLGASKGLGFMVLWATNSFKYAETYAYIIIIALIGAGANYIMSVFIKKYKRS